MSKVFHGDPIGVDKSPYEKQITGYRTTVMEIVFNPIEYLVTSIWHEEFGEHN